jgi:PST family polysaccharide transporter
MTDSPNPELTPGTAPSPPGDGLATATARGAAWSFVIFVAGKVLSFVGSALLARILAPDTFGVVAIALLALTFLDVLNEFGVSASVVHSDDDTDHAASTAFTLSLITGMGATVLLVALAPLIARWFHEPAVTSILQVLSLTFLIDSVGTVHEARLRRALRFKDLMLPELLGSAMKLVVSVVLAWAGAGVWSVVAGNIAGTFITTALYWVALKWIPRLTLDRAVAGPMIRYGSKIAASGFLFLLMRDIDYVIIGRSLPVAALAAYTVAFRLPDLAVTGIPFAVRRATFPFFSRLRHDLPRLQVSYVRVFRALALITTPIACGIAVTSPDMVQLIYGSDWVAAGPVMQWLALYAGLATLAGAPGPLYSAIGRPGITSMILLARVPVTVGVLWWVVDQGIEAIAIAQVCLVTAFLMVSLEVTRRVITLRWRDVGAMVGSVAVSSIGLVAASLSVRSLLSDSPLGFRLAATVAAGVVGYAVPVALFERDNVSDALRLFRGKAPASEIPSAATPSATNTHNA